VSLKAKINLLPTEPGCYLMKNKNDEVIYVGKAKNLKNRVKSYFTGAHNEKTTRLVLEIHDFNYVLTNSEQESLILENNLIKQYTPKYNIRLVDDKTYPYIELTKEKYPKLQVVRKKKPEGRIFGPYPNVYAARETARLLNRLYPLRKCETMPKKVCLYYHIGQCLGPCEFDVNYKEDINEIIRFLKGDTKEVLNKLKTEMDKASSQMFYEKAIEYRDMIRHIESTTEKQIININDFKDRDAISFAYNEDDISIQILKMRSGKIVDHDQIVFAYVGEYMDSVLSYLQQYYEDHMPDELLFSDRFNLEEVTLMFNNKVVMPQKGDKKKIVDLASKNADYDLEHHYMLYRHKQEKTQIAIDDLSQMIGAEVKTIEIFDNAQLFGTAPISALVVYKDQAFDKKGYRKYHLKTTTNDDYQAMREVVYRRYQRLLVESKPMPDLILVDGGKGQLNAATEVLNELNLDIKVAGLKKNKKHQLEALVYKGDVYPLLRNSEVYQLLLSISEEVHRFAISFHRKTRDKVTQQSILDHIKGIGPKRKQTILQTFKSLDEIKDASDEKLKEIGLTDEIIEALREVIQ
jgi:excinuclease ABC subunit C